jgi:SAM-dependent methyltransferase
MDLMERFYPESRFGGFTNVDGTINFYLRVNALLSPEDVLLDYGCGRGRYQDDEVRVRRELRIFQGKVKRVIGLDVDQHGAENPYLDEFRILEGPVWPVEDDSVDLIVCDWVIEHIRDPAAFFKEARRVLADGGSLCVRTSNLLGYAGFLSWLIPNRFHAPILQRVQKKRKEEDVFPTYNRCNTPGKMRRCLREHDFSSVVYTHESEPAYLQFSRFLYRLGVWYQKIVPGPFRSTIMAFARVEQ